MFSLLVSKFYVIKKRKTSKKFLLKKTFAHTKPFGKKKLSRLIWKECIKTPGQGGNHRVEVVIY